MINFTRDEMELLLECLTNDRDLAFDDMSSSFGDDTCFPQSATRYMLYEMLLRKCEYERKHNPMYNDNSPALITEPVTTRRVLQHFLKICPFDKMREHVRMMLEQELTGPQAEPDESQLCENIDVWLYG